MTSRPTIEEADVVIVGARLAGCAAAITYAKAGARVIAIDRAHFPSNTPSTHGMFSSHVAEVAAIGALPKVLALNPPRITSITIAHGETMVSEPMSDCDGLDYGLVVGRPQLDAAVLATARDAGVDVRERSTATGVLRDRGRVTGIRYTNQGREFQINAPLVIGADGRRSRMAKFLDVERPYRTSTNQRGVAWRYLIDERDESLRDHMFISRGRTIIMAAPMPDGVIVHIAIPPIEEMPTWRSGSDAQWAQLVHSHPHFGERFAGARSDPTHLSKSGLPPGMLRCSDLTAFFRVSCGPGWALAGDAGHFKDPVVGQGIRDALRSGRRLAEMTLRHLDSPQQLDRALTRWEMDRDRDCHAAYHWGNRESRVDPLLDAVSKAALESFTHTPPGGRRLTDVFCRRWRTDQVIGLGKSSSALLKTFKLSRGRRRDVLAVGLGEARIELDLLAERHVGRFRSTRVLRSERPGWSGDQREHNIPSAGCTDPVVISSSSATPKRQVQHKEAK